MPRKKAQIEKNSTKIRNSSIAAALDLAAESPWEWITLAQIAEKAGFGKEKVAEIFPDKTSIVEAIIDHIDTQIETIFSEQDIDLSPRDKLFDVLMERFEILNRNRTAHLSILNSFGWTAQSVCPDLKILKSSMIRMANCAGIETKGLVGFINITGLKIIYIWVTLIWCQDNSSDLGRTMAELDKTLGRADFVKKYIDEYMGHEVKG